MPTLTGAYTVTATGVGGCTSTAVANVTVNPIPTVSTTVSNSVICNGNNTTLTANGYNLYLDRWGNKCYTICANNN
jgi:hypothetical protein